MKKLVSLCVVLAVLLTLFSACSGTSGNAVSPEAKTETSTGAGAGGESEKFTLRIASTQPNEDELDIAAEMFKEKYPDANIEFEVAPWGPGGKSLRDKQLILISSGTELDIGKMIWAKEFYSKGVLEDMTDAVKSWPLYERYTDGQKERILYNGRIVAPTRGNETVYNFYNKDIFAQIGVAEPPKTFDDIVEIAKKIKDANLTAPNGKTVYALNFEGGNWVTDYWLWAGGGQQMNEDYTKTLIDTPESIEAYKFMQEFVKNGWAPKPDGTYNQQWLNGQVAMWFCGDWDVQSTVDAGINVGFAEMPVGPTGKNTVSIGGIEWAVFKTSKNKEKAIEFLEILFSDELAKKTGLHFSDLSLYDDPDVQEVWKQESQARYESKMVQAKQLKNSKYNFLEAPYIFADASKIYNEALEKVLVRLDNPEDAMREASAAINKGIEEAMNE